jgi:hypothetical protein
MPRKVRKPDPRAIRLKKHPVRKPPYTPEQIASLKSRALKLWHADEDHAKELGMALLQVRLALRNQHGAFRKWWVSNKLSQARVPFCLKNLARRRRLYPRHVGFRYPQPRPVAFRCGASAQNPR